MTPAPGVLYVVATPIGNLEDLTFRALRILKSVDLIAAEDTRRTAKLLAHYAIQKPVTSLREHNETRETARVLDRLKAGQSVALVSDAGTPAVADPGARLVAAARAHHLKVVPIPGPSAVTAALSVSGLSAPEFLFLGFPPATGAVRRRFFEDVAREPRAVVLFEAPHRIGRTLNDLGTALVNRPIHIHRELTKINEEYVKQPNTAGSQVRETGEFTIIIEPTRISEVQAVPPANLPPDIIGRLIQTELFTDSEVVDIVAAVNSTSPQSAAKAIKKHRFSVKQRSSSAT